MVVILVVRINEVYPVLRPFRPAIMTAVVATLLSVAFTPQAAWRAVVRNPQFRRVVGYIVVAALMLPFALWKGNSFSVVETMLLFDVPLVTAVLLCAPRLSTLERLLTTYVVATTGYALAVMAARRVVETDRLTSSASYDPNDLAALFCIALPIACALIARRRAGWQRLVGLVCAPILLYTITLTGSRGGLIALVVGALVLLGGYNAGRLVPAALVVTLAAPVVWSQAPETFRTRAKSILALEEDYNTQSTSGRKYIWKRGLSFFARSPVIGVGPGNFDVKLGRDFAAQGTTGYWHTAHNTPIQVLAELGAAGGFFFAAMMWASFRAAARVYRPGRGAEAQRPHYPELTASLASFCTSAMFLSHGYVHFMFFLVAFVGGYAARVFDLELGPARSRRALRR
jgi:O-antigen ligase